ncbi:MAG TPA: pyrroline-5-carboxylate reductase [Rhabdochlamydiaceae bacterium]|jgi:pyrroline-5-carboxylate reductase
MKIALIGCGNIGSSMAKQLALLHSIAVYDRHPEKITLDLPQIKIYRDPKEAIAHAEWIILAFKPHDLKTAAEQLRSHLHPHQVILSVLAGASLKYLKEALGENNTLVRMMPNLAVEYGEGVIGFAENPEITPELKEHLTSVFSPMGLILWLSEEKMNALTALAGSGPAFILIFIEAMIDAGIALGFTSGDAKNIVMQTLLGTLSLVEHTGKHPGELRWQISSPAGTTIAGKIALEDAKVRSGIIHTFLAAYRRAKELVD